MASSSSTLFTGGSWSDVVWGSRCEAEIFVVWGSRCEAEIFVGCAEIFVVWSFAIVVSGTLLGAVV